MQFLTKASMELYSSDLEKNDLLYGNSRYIK